MTAYKAAMTRVRAKWYPFITYALMHVCTSVLRGLGKSVTATVAMLLGTCALRVVWLKTVFLAFPTLGVIYWSYPVSWMITGLAPFGMLLLEFRRMGKKKEDDVEITR